MVVAETRLHWSGRTFFTGFQQGQADLEDGVKALRQEKVEDAKHQRQRELG
jgi:hypothetical protein